MKISAIQPKMYNHYSTNLSCKRNEQPIPSTAQNPSFKGSGKGFVAGSGAGLITTLITISAGAIAGAFTLPLIIGGGLLLGGTAVGGFLGDKIEDKITGKKDSKE